MAMEKEDVSWESLRRCHHPSRTNRTRVAGTETLTWMTAVRDRLGHGDGWGTIHVLEASSGGQDELEA